VPSVDRSAANSEETAVIRANRRRAVRLAVLPGVIVGFVVGAVIGAVSGLALVGVALFVVVTVVFTMWWWQRAPGAVLRAVGASPSQEADRPRLHNLVDGLCATMGLPAPDISVVDSDIPNAMAVGRDPRSATLVVTSALDYSLSLVELEGVLAHELVHVKRHDTVVAALAVTTMAPWSALVGADRASARVHALAGEGREFDADRRAAGVVRYPPGIGSALETMLEGSGLEGSGLEGSAAGEPWPPGRGRTAALTRWLWIDPTAGDAGGPAPVGNLDDTRVRAAALALE
jgi:Zn-dependent protease with chaperone function